MYIILDYYKNTNWFHKELQFYFAISTLTCRGKIVNHTRSMELLVTRVRIYTYAHLFCTLCHRNKG